MESDLRTEVEFRIEPDAKQEPASSLLLVKCADSEIRRTDKVQFACADCDAPVLLPGAEIARGRYETNCTSCDRPISIDRIDTDDGLEIVTLEGCFHVGRRADLHKPPRETFHPLHHTSSGPPPPRSHSDLFAEVNTLWRIERAQGLPLVFRSLAQLRRAIRSGKVTAADRVIPSRGDSCAANSLAGVADLFGNSSLARRARRNLFLEASPVGRRRYKRLWRSLGRIVRATPSALALASISAALVLSTRLMREFDRWQGERLVARLSETAPTIAPDPNTLVSFSSLLAGESTQSLRRAEVAWHASLLSRGDKGPVLAGLASVYAELFQVEKSKSYLRDAGRLVRYAESLGLSSPELTRAKARVLWRKGKAERAVELLDRLIGTKADDENTRHLIARMELERGRYNEMTIHISEAMRMNASEPGHVLLAAEGMERQNKHAEAASFLSRLEGHPGRPAGFGARLAEAYRKAGDTESSAAALKRAIRRNEDAEGNRYELIKLLDRTGDPRSLLAATEEFLDLHPGSAHYADVHSFYQKAVTDLSQPREPPAERFRSERRRPRNMGTQY